MQKRIGVFDSGLGGLTVVKALLERLPDPSLTYFGDTARVPYGTKSQATIIQFSEENIRFLLTLDVDMIVIGCHTASSLALDRMRQLFDLPIFGVVDPGAKKAVESSKKSKIGVIGTKSTIESRAYEAAIHQNNPDIEVLGIACPLFVPLIEEGWLEGEVVQKIALEYLKPFKDSKIDTLILGCTHYPVLSPIIQGILGPQVQLINPAEETALTVSEHLSATPHLNRGRKEHNEVQYYVSDAPSHFQKMSARFLGAPAKVVKYVDEARFERYSA
ncbi:MAG: glutamate racemase [Candidatus Omnitrophota bacterium]|jgi:glutamate racemase